MLEKKLKYVIQKTGGGCGSGKRFVPVSCSKNCFDCHGCSPGCGKNFEFEKIKEDFNPSEETWKILRSLPSQTHPYEYCVILYF